MKYIKKFEKYSQIGENIVIVESIHSYLETEDVSKVILSESAQNIGKDIVKVIPGKNIVYIK
jgi:hypothetical protein